MPTAFDAGAFDPLDPGLAHAAEDAGERLGQADLFERRVIVRLVDLVIVEQNVLGQSSGTGHVFFLKGLAIVVADVVQAAPARFAIATARQR